MSAKILAQLTLAAACLVPLHYAKKPAIEAASKFYWASVDINTRSPLDTREQTLKKDADTLGDVASGFKDLGKVVAWGFVDAVLIGGIIRMGGSKTQGVQPS